MSHFIVRRVAVLGAGVMGAQIAAHLINLKVPVILFDLPSDSGDPNAIALRAIEGLKKLRPAPLGLSGDASLIQPANYRQHLALLGDCDLIIEAIAERMDWKRDLYQLIAPHVSAHTVMASNTSGLSMTALSQELPASLRAQFCGVHFFNPPRYMNLVELIPTPTTAPHVLDQLEAFVTTTLGKGVVRAKDTPNFVANRIGVANMLFTLIEAERAGLSCDVVDDLTGKKLGRASSGTYRTADVVGLDTLMHVVRTMHQLTDDPFRSSYDAPAVVEHLIAAGWLGAKSGAGFYKKVGKDILRLDTTTMSHVAGGEKSVPEIDAILKLKPAERLAALRATDHPHARFLWAQYRNMFHYCAVHLSDVAYSARDMDFALRWGFGWKEGPFETWQQAGWQQVAQWVAEDISAGEALCSAPLPAWVMDGRTGVHQAEGSWSAATARYEPTSTLPVYQRQYFPEQVIGAGGQTPATAGRTVFEDGFIRAWTLDDEVLIASIKTKMRTFNTGALTGLGRAVEEAEQHFKAMVIWGPGEPFSAGGDLKGFLTIYANHGVEAFRLEERIFQDVMRQLRYSQIPTVAAVKGYALGGGCEAYLHSDRRVVHMETFVGLVEVKVGLLPGAGGLTTLTRRAGESALLAGNPHDVYAYIKDAYQRVVLSAVSTSANEARQMGLLQEGDVVVAHADELLFVALSQARAMSDSGYRPPLQQSFPVCGRDGKANMVAALHNLRDAGQLTDYDVVICTAIADVMCGGEVDAGTFLMETDILALERKHFGELMEDVKTRERIQAMLDTGKPLRN